MTTTGTAHGCPVNESFDPLSPDFLANPYAAMAALPRGEEQPIFFAPSIGYYVLTRYADIEQVFRDPATYYPAAAAQAPLVPLVPEAQQILFAGGHKPQPSMVSLDEPEHARLRKPAARAFSMKRVTALIPVIEATTAWLLDAVGTATEFDVVAALAFPLPGQHCLLPDGRARAGLRPDQALEQIPGSPGVGTPCTQGPGRRSRPAWPLTALTCANWSRRRFSSPVTT